MKAKAQRVPSHEPIQKKFRKDGVITFSESDAVPPIMPKLDALVISMIVANHEVKRVYVDNGVAVSILFLNYFLKPVLN